MTGTTVGDQVDYVEFGVEDMRWVAGSGAGSVRPAEVFQQGNEGVNDDINRGYADPEQGGACDKDDVILKEVLDCGAGSVWELGRNRRVLARAPR